MQTYGKPGKPKKQEKGRVQMTVSVVDLFISLCVYFSLAHLV